MRAKQSGKPLSWLVPVVLFCMTLAVYMSRMAPTVVPGDPGEYQLVAARWGIGHPPGYGFYALLGNLFTHLLPVGTFAWRANLLSATCGAAIVALAYGIGQTLLSWQTGGRQPLRSHVPPILGALALGSGADLWQHSIHANSHIVTALLVTSTLFCLLRWWRSERPGSEVGTRWLLASCLLAGISPVHHPLLVFAFPAYVAFVLVVRPSILRRWRTLLQMVGCVLLGLSLYLYYPIRSALGAPPPPGPSDMNTWHGFVRVVTAQGLRGNLMGFSAGEILQRLLDVRVPLGMQYTPVLLFVGGIGLIGLWARHWRPALLLSGYIAATVLVTVNVLQDAMAYLLGPVVVVGTLIGFGTYVVLAAPARFFGEGKGWRGATNTLIGGLAVLSLWPAIVNWNRIDLSDYREADDWLAAIDARFGGEGQNAVLLTEWERMTTVYYYAAVEGRTWDERDVRFVPVSSGTEAPFLSAAQAYMDVGPVYLTSFRPKVADRYRLMPSGVLWQVLPAWPGALPEGARSVSIVSQEGFEIVGWRLDREQAQAGDLLLLDLYMRMGIPEGEVLQQYYLPWAKLGETTYSFTTDKRFLTPRWEPGEIVVERFELPVAWKIAPGLHPLQVGVRWINTGQDLTLNGGGTLFTLTEVEVRPPAAGWEPSERLLSAALGSLRGEILLSAARINGRKVPVDRRMTIRPGRILRVALAWESLRPVDENLTVFVQLLDTGLQVRAQSDMTPLGGSAPTWLWFPRWRRGTRVTDTHLLEVPADLPPGQYPLVVGMYGFSTNKRVQVVSADGDVEGDWITLGHLWVD